MTLSTVASFLALAAVVAIVLAYRGLITFVNAKAQQLATRGDAERLQQKLHENALQLEEKMDTLRRTTEVHVETLRQSLASIHRRDEQAQTALLDVLGTAWHILWDLHTGFMFDSSRNAASMNAYMLRLTSALSDLFAKTVQTSALIDPDKDTELASSLGAVVNMLANEVGRSIETVYPVWRAASRYKLKSGEQESTFRLAKDAAAQYQSMRSQSQYSQSVATRAMELFDKSSKLMDEADHLFAVFMERQRDADASIKAHWPDMQSQPEIRQLAKAIRKRMKIDLPLDSLSAMQKPLEETQ